MSEQDVKIVRLEAMRVMSFNGFGASPEELALGKLFSWAKANGMKGRVFGFNNPNPSAGSPNYGYDAWMVVSGDMKAEGEGELLDFPGGLYAVARCEVNLPGEEIPAAWQELVRWREASHYLPGSHQWLEEHIVSGGEPGGAQFTLDLFLPIREG